MTQHMTKTALVLSMPADMKTAEVARLTGFKEDLVRTIRWIKKHPDRKRKHQRETYQRLKETHGYSGGIEGGKWHEADDLVLIRMIRAGKSYTECGKALRVTRNCVAGRVKRLRDGGRL